MNGRRGPRRSERGQATLELVIVFPLLFGLFELALAVAAVSNAHHLLSALSLEGASRDSAQAGTLSIGLTATSRGPIQLSCASEGGRAGSATRPTRASQQAARAARRRPNRGLAGVRIVLTGIIGAIDVGCAGHARPASRLPFSSTPS